MRNDVLSVPFAILAVLVVGSAVAAMTMRHLVRCALALVVTFAGLAALYLQLDAPFVGFAQVLVYVGAVAVLIVFAILLTRGSEPVAEPIFSPGWIVGLGVASGVFALLAWMTAKSHVLTRAAVPDPQITVRQIGDQLMLKYILPLEVVGLLLTAALIGGVIVAMRDTEPKV
jgi:NADH-quinone oxidoreductase subunit J